MVSLKEIEVLGGYHVIMERRIYVYFSESYVFQHHPSLNLYRAHHSYFTLISLTLPHSTSNPFDSSNLNLFQQPGLDIKNKSSTPLLNFVPHILIRP